MHHGSDLQDRRRRRNQGGASEAVSHHVSADTDKNENPETRLNSGYEQRGD